MAYRIVICFTMSPPLPVTPPSLDVADAEPGFFSKIFQNLRLSSAARVNVSLYPMSTSELSVLTSCGKHLTIWTQAAVENSGFVCWYFNIAYQGWITPDTE